MNPESATERHSIAAVRGWAMKRPEGSIQPDIDRLQLALPGQGTVSAHRRHAIERGPDDFTWIGRIPPAQDDVVLTFKHGLVSGLIYANEEVFEVRPHPRYGSVLLELNHSAFPDCDGQSGPASFQQATSRAKLGVGPELLKNRGEGNGSDGTEPIDLLILHNQGALKKLGGQEAIETLAEGAVGIANTAFLNSDIEAEFRVVHMAAIEFNRSNSCTDDLNGLRDNDMVRLMREVHQADVVSLIVESEGRFDDDYCGCAKRLAYASVPEGGEAGYHVTTTQCTNGNMSLAHEAGHNMGLEHDPDNGPSPSNAIYPWSFGHYDHVGLFRTIMSYRADCSFCSRRMHFSNPSVQLKGIPTGIPEQRDNARTARITAPIVASFRSGSQSTAACVEGEVAARISAGFNPVVHFPARFGLAGGQGSLKQLDLIFPAPPRSGSGRGVGYATILPDGSISASQNPAYIQGQIAADAVADGRLEILACLPEQAQGGLAIAIYEDGSEDVIGYHASSLALESSGDDQRHGSVVFNHATTNAVGLAFNQAEYGKLTSSAALVHNLEFHYGISVDASSVSAVQLINDLHVRSQIFSSAKMVNAGAKLYRTEGLFVEGGNIFVTASDEDQAVLGSSARSLYHDITDMNDVSIVEEDSGLVELENRIDETLVAHGFDRRNLLNVVEGRTLLAISHDECVDGEFRLDAGFAYDSPLSGRISVQEAESEILVADDGRVDVYLECDRDYQVRGTRITPQGNKLPAAVIELSVSGD